MTDTLLPPSPTGTDPDPLARVRARLAPLLAEIAEGSVRREVDGELPTDAVRRLAEAGVGGAAGASAGSSQNHTVQGRSPRDAARPARRSASSPSPGGPTTMAAPSNCDALIGWPSSTMPRKTEVIGSRFMINAVRTVPIHEMATNIETIEKE